MRMGTWRSGEGSKEELAGGGSILVPHLPPVKAAPNGALKKNYRVSIVSFRFVT
jgi:hypothetical protein